MKIIKTVWFIYFAVTSFHFPVGTFRFSRHCWFYLFSASNETFLCLAKVYQGLRLNNENDNNKVAVSRAWGDWGPRDGGEPCDYSHSCDQTQTLHFCFFEHLMNLIKYI